MCKHRERQRHARVIVGRRVVFQWRVVVFRGVFVVRWLVLVGRRVVLEWLVLGRTRVVVEQRVVLG